MLSSGNPLDFHPKALLIESGNIIKTWKVVEALNNVVIHYH